MRVGDAVDVAELISISRRVRAHILRMSAVAKAPHVGSALSCADILVALYFHAARVAPEKPDDPERDIVILSKGHGSAALYSVLAERGYFALATLDTYCADGSVLAEHPSRGCVPGVEVTTGSLGHGLGVGVGMAVAAKLASSARHVYVVLSDGECNEGSVWEAAMWAPGRRLANVTAIVDFNKFQATGPSTQITALEPLAEKWRAFGWDTLEIDGHDYTALVHALTFARQERPRAIVAHTLKGKGVSFMEGNLEWHYRPPSAADLELALEEVARS